MEGLASSEQKIRENVEMRLMPVGLNQYRIADIGWTKESAREIREEESEGEGEG